MLHYTVELESEGTPETTAGMRIPGVTERHTVYATVAFGDRTEAEEFEAAVRELVLSR
jgi:hypothetical protein